MNITIFYSWQTTTDTKFNKSFIYSCIEKAIKKLQQKPTFKDVKFEIQEGIRGEPGSPPVASKITDERIPNCDIFIADLSVVNQVSKLSKFITNLLGDKFKPFQNNNVINEHGIALNALGPEKIIHVLNNAYGSPNENPDNIPFDLRHLRFPIEYDYCKKTSNKDKVQEALINDLRSTLELTTKYALQHQRDKYKPLNTWTDWENSQSISQSFFSNDKIEEIREIILKNILKPKESIRLLGLSGLGKTRILLEIFRPKENDVDFNLISSRVLYINCNLNPSADFQAVFKLIQKKREDRIVILDNCSISQHRDLLSFINHKENIISLITLDSNPEEIKQDKINNVNYIVIKKEDLSSIVSDILNSDFSMIGKENIEKIKQFSQGIPLMAVLIGDNVKKGEKFIGKLDDKELLDKLLGEKGQDVRCRTILKSCSIFNYFGIEDDLRSQMEFIAKDKDITLLDGSDPVLINEFDEVCNHFLKREIFERKGRLIGMRPFPLAMSLAQEWLEPCTPERLIKIIQNISNLSEPHRKNLSDALAEQMKYLGYNDKAVSIIEKIVGDKSPFDNAEVLNTELGSRLFRSFVEVNPVAVSQNFIRLFSSKSKAELLKIDEGRRNIIWTLEKLCFDKRTFADAAKIMCDFAVAENETWSNNATGQFLHLFQIRLPGTEALLLSRMEIIKWALAKNNDDYTKLAVNAMGRGLSNDHFTRMTGAENQGSSISLKDNDPSWSEVIEYWNFIIEELTKIACSDSIHSNPSKVIIAQACRTLIRDGEYKILVNSIKTINKAKGIVWPEALNNLKRALSYEKHLHPEIIEEINVLITELTPADIKNQLLFKVSKPEWDSYEKDQDGNYIDKPKLNAEAFAQKIIDEGIPWRDYIQDLLIDEQRQAFNFGKKIIELSEDKEQLINLTIEQLKTINQKNQNAEFIAGLLVGANNRELFEKTIDKFIEDDNLRQNSFYLTRVLSPSLNDIKKLFVLIDKHEYSITQFRNFQYGRSLNKLSNEEVIILCDRVSNYGNTGEWTALSLLYMYVYGDENKWEATKYFFKSLIINSNMLIGNDDSNSIEYFHWSETIDKILIKENDDEFAIAITKQIIEVCSQRNLNYSHDTYISNVVMNLCNKYFEVIWKYLGEGVIGDYLTFFHLEHIIGSRNSFHENSEGIIFRNRENYKIILDWCNNYPDIAPVRMAHIMPLSVREGDEIKWHPFSKDIINLYGNNEKVLSELSSNMASFGSIGSSVPYYVTQKKLLEDLKNHHIPKVKDWALKMLEYTERAIKQEQLHDEEHYL